MYGNKVIMRRKDGTRYIDYFYYGCKHRNMTRGHKCYSNKETILSDLDYEDKYYQRRKSDLKDRLDKVYDKIVET